MKIIKYQLCTHINNGTEETPEWVDILSDVTMGWNEANEAIAQREAYNGEYTIEDDGQPDPIPSGDDSAMWDELDKAYQEGVDSV